MIKETGEQPKKRVTHGNPEAQIQASCVSWLWNTYPETRGLYFAVPNELSTSNRMSKQDQLREGAKRRAMGVLHGVSDTILLMARGGYHGACIEYKTHVGYQSDAQKEFEARVKMEGYVYVVIRSLDDFKQFIEYYLSL
jgi:hypothetical protein